MVNENKSNVMSAVAGVVVGAGAVIAGAIALNDKANQKKVANIVTKAKDMVKDYGQDINEQKEQGKVKVKKVANKVIKSAEQVTKSAKKEVKNL